MPRAPATRLLGLALVGALLASGAAQGLLLYRCHAGSVRLSRCCPEKSPPAAATLEAECCRTLVLPPADASQGPREPAKAPEATTAVALPSPIAAPASPFCAVAGPPPLRRPPPRPPPVTNTCSRLI